MNASSVNVNVSAKVTKNGKPYANQAVSVCGKVEYQDMHFFDGHNLAYKEICGTGITDEKGNLELTIEGSVSDWTGYGNFDHYTSAKIIDVTYYGKIQTSKGIRKVRALNIDDSGVFLTGEVATGNINLQLEI